MFRAAPAFIFVLISNTMTKIRLAILLILSAKLSAQTHYYVSPAGNNNNNGLSLTTAWKTIQKALNSATPNSIVYIKGGTYHESLVANVSGSANARITYTNYNGETVIVDGSSGVSGTTMLSATNRSYLTFENMTLQNMTSPYANGIRVNTWDNGSSTGMIFRNIRVSGIGWTQNATEMPGYDDNAIGIYICGEVGPISNITVDGCEVSDNITGYSEAVSVYGQVSNFTIKNCLVHDNTNIGIHVSGINDDGYGPAGGTISANTCYRNASPIALSAGIYIDGSHDMLIERNSCYDNPIGIEVGCEGDGEATNITVRNNLIYNNRNTGLSVGGYDESTSGQVVNSTFRNNTLYKNNSLNTGQAELTISKTSNCVFEDNLFYGTQNVLLAMLDISPQQNNTINYNGWYTSAGNPNNITMYIKQATYHSFTQYRNASGFDADGVFANPNFLSLSLPQPVLTLPIGNTYINAGNPQIGPVSGELDFDGNPRLAGSAMDLGAREVNATLGLDEVSAATSGFAPNPVKDMTTFHFTKPLDSGSISIFDTTGKLVWQSSTISSDSASVDLSALRTGIYLYAAGDAANGFTTGKLCKI
jgi:hypothetical protein